MKSLSIRAKLTVASVATVTIALVLLTVANLWAARRAAESTVFESVRALSDGHAHALGDWVAAKASVIKALVPSVKAADAMPLLVQAQHAGRFETTYIGWSDKRHQFSAPQNIPPGWDPTSRPWYQQAAAAGGPVLTSPYADVSTKALIVTFAAPVIEGGQTKAVVAGDVFITDMVNSVKAIKPSAHSFAYLVGSDGTIIAHPDAGLSLKPSTEAVAGVDGARLKSLRDEDKVLAVDIGAEAYWLTARQIPRTDWTLVIAMNTGDALSGLSAMRKASAVTGLAAVLAAACVLTLLATALLRRLGDLRDALQGIASGDGDLTKRLDTTGSDELSQVAGSFNQFVDKIAGTLRSIQMTTDSVNTAASEIASGNHDLSARTEDAAANLQETASSMEQLTGAVRQTAESASTANQLAASAAGAAQRGGTVVAQVVTTMQSINHSSKKIGDIIAVIDGIAFQTNILALNAAVEAARAGEQGRGFAVVASEVRALAQRSAGAAKEIKGLITTSVDTVAEGTRLVQDAGTAMGEIVSSVQRVSDVIGKITAAASEQSEGISQVGVAVTQLDQMTQQNAALVEESAAAAQSLREQAATLASAVGGFQL